VTPNSKDQIEAQCERLVRDRFPEGLLGVLRKNFPAGRYQDYEDAIGRGFEKLVEKGVPLENPRGYVTTVAINAMRGVLARAAREQLPTEEDDEPEVDHWANPTGDEAVLEAVYAFMRELVEKWESRNVRTAVLLVLEAGRLLEPLSNDELAERLEELLEQDVLPNTAKQWRKRGLDRLREELHAADLWTDKELR
jgi:DNA-directed RNA polymerase specialized sigma24 family protein